MAPVELHSDLWLQIIQLLHRPLPRPGGKLPRSAVAQNDLVSCLRVNKLLHNITAPLLYKDVVVDNLSSFVFGIDQSPAATGIPSKRALISYMERLFLEYGPKTEVTYSQLLRSGESAWARVGIDEAGMEELCIQEYNCMSRAFGQLEGVRHKLLSVATGAFLDVQDDIWRPMKRHMATDKRWFDLVSRAFDSLSKILRSKRVYYCQRIFYGPLTYNADSIGKAGVSNGTASVSAPTAFSHRAHHSYTERVDGNPILRGGSSRWYCPLNADPEFKWRRVMDWVGTAIEDHITTRERTAPLMDMMNQVSGKPPIDWSINIDIYAPAVVFGPSLKAEMERVVAKAKKEVERRNVPQSRCGKDVWRVMSLDEAPPCEGCGWRADDLW